MYLNSIVKKKDDKFTELVEYLGNTLNQNQMQKVYTHFQKAWKLNKRQQTDAIVMNENDLIKLAQNKDNQ